MSGARKAGAPAEAPRALNATQLGGLKRKLAALARRFERAAERAQGEILGEDAELFRDLTRTGDGALAEAELERDLAGAEQVRGALAAIRAAEDRIATGEYGTCAECGRPIGFARLSAQPAALRCVACQESLEAGAGRRKRA